MNKQELLDYIERYVKNSAVESFTNLRLQNILVELAGDANSSLITDCANTTVLQTLSGANYTYVICTSSGIFEWAATGTPNGTTIFAATGGGVWNLIFTGGGGGGVTDWADITNKPATFAPTVPIAATDITEDPSNRFVTDVEKATWNAGSPSTLDDLTDVVITAPGISDTLEYNGSGWVNVPKDFTELIGTTWDGSNKYKALTGNLSLTLSTTRPAGLLYISSNTSYTLTVNTQPVTINNTGDTIISYIYQNGTYVLSVELNPILVEGPDVIAPTVVTASAIDDTHIEIVFDEVCYGTNVGHSFKKNGSPLVPSALAGTGTDTFLFTVPIMLDTDVLLRSYNSGTGDTMDASSNELASYTDQPVINDIVTLPYTSTKSFDSNGLVVDIDFAVLADFEGSLNGTDDEQFTIGYWVKHPVNTGTCTFKLVNSSNQTIYALANSGYGYSSAVLYSSPGNGLVKISNTDFPVNVWAFFVMTYDGSKTNAGLKNYANASLVSMFNSNEGTYIGMPISDGNLAFNLKGLLDDAFYVNRVLTPAEITEAYNAGIPFDLRTATFGADIKGFWTFENFLEDISVSAVHDGSTAVELYSSDRPM